MKDIDLIPENLNDSLKQLVKNWFKKKSDNLIGGTTLGRFFHHDKLRQITLSHQYNFNDGHNFVL